MLLTGTLALSSSQTEYGFGGQWWQCNTGSFRPAMAANAGTIGVTSSGSGYGVLTTNTGGSLAALTAVSIMIASVYAKTSNMGTITTTGATGGGGNIYFFLPRLAYPLYQLPMALSPALSLPAPFSLLVFSCQCADRGVETSLHIPAAHLLKVVLYPARM